MDGWAPLAPSIKATPPPTAKSATRNRSSKRFSFLAGTRSAAAAAAQGGQYASAASADSNRVKADLPIDVAIEILHHVPLPDLVACSLAGRSLARVVADDRLWQKRWKELDWADVEGLHVEAAVSAEEDAAATITPQRKPSIHADAADDDDFGDFAAAGPSSASAADDTFGDFASAPAPSSSAAVGFGLGHGLGKAGGSLANGMASVTLAGQSQAHHPNAVRPATMTSFEPMSPTPRYSNGTGAAHASIFSFSRETQLPIPRGKAYGAFKACALALKPFIKELREAPRGGAASVMPELGLIAQVRLLRNVARFVGPSVQGTSSPATPKAAAQFELGDDDENRQDEFEPAYGQGSDAGRSPELFRTLSELFSHLESLLLSAFDGADARRSDAIRAASLGADSSKAVKRAEEDMRTHAYSLWELGRGHEAIGQQRHSSLRRQQDEEGARAPASRWDRSDVGSGVSCGVAAAQAFLQRRKIFYTQAAKGREHDPLANILNAESATPALDFTPMDKFMTFVLDQVTEEGSFIARVFPPQQDVLLAFADRVAVEVIAEYVSPLLLKARSVSTHLYLRACAAVFTQALRIVDTLLAIEPSSSVVSRPRCEDVVYRMWEVNMDDYLQVEGEWVQDEMEQVCEKWEQNLENEAAASRMDAAFVGSQNPAAVKRSVLTSFKDVLLLPVTVVPRTAGYVGGAVIRSAGSGLSQLNPMRWQAGGASSKGASVVPGLVGGSGTATPTIEDEKKGYVEFSEGGDEKQEEEDDDEEEQPELRERDFGALANAEGFDEMNAWGSAEKDPWATTNGAMKVKKRSVPLSERIPPSLAPRAPMHLGVPPAASTPPISRTASPSGRKAAHLSRMQLLLSLDTCLQLIHIHRDCVRRLETFNAYPGTYGERVREAFERVATAFFACLGERHVVPGFSKATKQVREWDAREHEREVKAQRAKLGDSAGADEEEAPVAPLVHFFELVHVGDTIAQMVQVYYDEELSRHIDRTDFLNVVVRDKKRFEGALDECVAAGLNAGVDLLMGQAEYIVSTRQEPTDYCPLPGHADLDLANPTKACRECVECLRTHCKMLVGSTDKNVLEVFYQEVGIRLHAIICKHLKRQLISLDGGFQLIADLNAYHAFVASLRQPSLNLFFDALKRLGNLYIIDSPRELAQIARDANMFGGTLSPEDLYEFLQARSDFRAIEKAIDKEMYGFKVAEDCVIA